MNERPIFLALAGVGAVLAGALSIPASDATGEIVPTAAAAPATSPREEPAEPPTLESSEASPREGRSSIREAGRRTVHVERAPASIAVVRPFPTDPVELRILPESTWSEMTFKRDGIEKHLSRFPRSKDPEHLSLGDEVRRLNVAIQERAIADYYVRKAELAAGAR